MQKYDVLIYKITYSNTDLQLLLLYCIQKEFSDKLTLYQTYIGVKHKRIEPHLK